MIIQKYLPIGKSNRKFMIYRIKIYKHSSLKTIIDDDIAKIIPYFESDFVKQFIDIQLDINVEKTKVPKQDSIIKLMQNSGYDCVIYLFEKGAFNLTSMGLCFNVDNKTQGIWLACDMVQDNIQYIWKSLVHEIIHALVYRVNQDYNLQLPNYLDYPIVDGKVSPYYGNEYPYLLNGNFHQQLAILTPYLKEKPIVTLARKTDDGVQTLGELTFGDLKCKTLERTWNNNIKNISCIPKGEYNVNYTFSPKFLKYTYEVQKVKGRSGIRIHSGNYFFDIEGCILLGTSYSDINKDGKVDVLDSRATIKRFETLLNKQSFRLKII